MLHFSKLPLACFMLSTGLFLVGCQSGGAQASASHEVASDAVACDKCQMTWVKYPITGGDKNRQIIGYSMHQKMECPDCKNAVSNFFATGNLEHGCKACGGNMEVCKAH